MFNLIRSQKIKLKILSLILFLLLIGSYTKIFAIGSPYNPGETLDPTCPPGEVNCTVLITGGSSVWTTSGSDIYYNTGNVGIGITNPSEKMEVDGNISVNGIFIGKATGTGTLNFAFGNGVLQLNTTGSNNFGMGEATLQENNTGSNNIALGVGALNFNTTGSRNIAIGEQSLNADDTFNDNISIGYQSGLYGLGGNSNILIGNYAGSNLTNNISNSVLVGFNSGYNAAGANNIFLGFNSGYHETGSNKLIIDNLLRSNETNGREQALIYGVSNATPANQTLSLGGGGKVGIGTTTPTAKLNVIGDILSTGNILGFNLSGVNTGDQTISDTTIILSDVITNNASSLRHGFLPKLENSGNKFLRDDGTWQTISSGGSGDVLGPASSVNNAITRFDGITGKLVQDTGVVIDDDNNIGVNNISPVAPIHVGDMAYGNSIDPQILIAREVDDTKVGNGHAFSDSSNITRSGGMAYNSFDARITFNGTNSYDHYAAFQVAPVYNSSGTMANFYGLYNVATYNSGNVTNNFGVYLANPYGTGAVANNYGIYIQGQTRGGTNNYSIYADGTSKSYFGGQIISNTGLRVGAASPFNAYTKQIEVQSATGTEAALRLYQLGQNYWDLKSNAGATSFSISDMTRTYVNILNSNAAVGIGVTPTAGLHLKAGTSTLSPLKLTSGTNLTIPEAGAIEWNGTNLFITQTTGPTRKTLAYTTDITSLSPITIVNNSNLFSSGSVVAGVGVTMVSNSIFLGVDAGNGATDANYSNFFGYQSGQGATTAEYSNFFGYQSGYESSAANGSNFFGAGSGYQATNASYSNFFGSQAGRNATNASYSNFFGVYAGRETNASSSNFLGYRAGWQASNASYSNFLGYQSGQQAYNARNSIFIGQSAGSGDTVNNTGNNDDFSILIGKSTNTGGYSNSIAIGGSATNTASNEFMIGSNTRPINTTVWVGASGTATLDTATGLITTSDERLKKNITDLEDNTLSKLINVRTVKFNWLNGDSDKTNIGFLAQDLENYFPELVYTGTDGYKGVNYANMTPVLVEAIREMDLKVKDLDEKINSLSTPELVKEFFEEVLIGVMDGVAYLKSIVVDSLKVGSPEKRTGITLYDEETGEPYCLSISGGQTKTKIGECEVVAIDSIDIGIEEKEEKEVEIIEVGDETEVVSDEIIIEEKNNVIDLLEEEKLEEPEDLSLSNEEILNQEEIVVEEISIKDNFQGKEEGEQESLITEFDN